MNDSGSVTAAGVTAPVTSPKTGVSRAAIVPGPASMARVFALYAAVVVAYVVSAWVGFRLAFVAEQVTTVWAPTGIALAALLVGGVGLWPAIWVGAFFANAGTSAPLWTALAIATGNTLEAVTAVWWLRTLHKFDLSFARIADVIAFALIAALSCTAISATLGVATLSVAGAQAWERFPTLWFDWWLGDALGAVVVAPAILTTVSHRWTLADGVRALLWSAGAMLVTHLVFGQVFGLSAHPLEYVVFPIMIAAAVTEGPRLTSLVVLGVSMVTIWHTVHGSGPFASPEVHYSLILVQAFMGVLAVTSLLLAAAIAERLATQRRERDSAANLRHREEMLRLAQRAGGVATFEWDIGNQVAHCSAEFFRIFGLSSPDGVMASAEWGRFVHPDDRERMAAHLARAIAGDEPPAADYRIIAADGRTRWLTYAGQLQKTPDGDRMLGTVVDITDRKHLETELRHHAAEAERILESIGQAQAALRENRDVLSLAMRSGSMGAWSRNLTTNEVWWSRELEEIFGLEPGEFDRTEAGFFEFVHEDDREAVRTAVEEAVRTNDDYIVEFRFKHADGGWRWMEGRGRAVFTDDGRHNLYGIGIDVTERKRAEIALRDAKIAAESANQLKDQFLATLSHELRTPLNAILGYARMLQTNSIAPEKRQRAIEVIERNAVAQNQLVEDLLDMSRITTGKIRLDPEPVPVVAVLRDAIEGIRPAADAKRIRLAVDCDPFAGTVRADTTRLQQVFWNVLTNAVKFTGDGGRITVSLERKNASVEIVVIDTGAGITAEFLPFIFEPFRQAESRWNRAHGGLGLGLAITRQLVELHGGTIDAASPGLGLGTTFTIRLPRLSGRDAGKEEATAGTRASDTALALTLDGLNVLLVDDEHDTLTMFGDALEAAGARVKAASSGVDALRIVESWQPDLLVTDIGLPEMDGYQLLRELRTRCSRDRCPAVAVSAYARPDDRARALAAGFQIYLSKPIDPSALVRALRGALSEPD